MRTPSLLAVVGLFALIAVGCSQSGAGPEQIADQFWNAAMEGDAATVEALSLPSENAKLNLDSDKRPKDLTLGKLTKTDDGAEIETKVVAGEEDATMTISFSTILVEKNGEWLVDLDQTTQSMMQGMFGGAFEQMGQAMADGMQEAMQGMADGMADAMEDLGESMSDAIKEAEASTESVENGH